MDSDSGRHILQRRGPGGLKHVEIRCVANTAVGKRETSIRKSSGHEEQHRRSLDGLRTRALAKKWRLRFLDMADGGTNEEDR